VSVVEQPAAKAASASKVLPPVLGKSRTPEAIPYVATFAVSPGFDLPKGFEMSRYQGLKLCFRITDPAGQEKLVCHWEDESHFLAHARSFQFELGLPQPDVAGFVTRVKTQEERFWRKYSWKEWVVGAAALFGAFSALHGYFANAFDRPDVDVVFVDSRPINVVAFAPFNTEMTIVNKSAYTPTRVEVAKAFALPVTGGNSVSLQPNLQKLPLIPAGQSALLQVDGLAPETTQRHGPPDSYNLELTVSARTGFFWGAREAKNLRVRELRVWPSGIGWGKPRPIAIADARQPVDFIRASVSIYPGRGYPGGVDGYVIVSSAADEDVVVRVIADRTEELPPSPPGDSVTHKVNFHTGALEKFLPYPLAVTLESKRNLTRKRWN